MDYGQLSSYFKGVAAKSLSVVDCDARVSHQHEYGGVGKLRALFGDDDLKGLDTSFVYLSDEDEPVSGHGFTTWYDTRRNQPQRSAEYRLYYIDNEASAFASPGDLLVVAVTPDMRVLIIFARQGSTAESQVRWLFGLGEGLVGRFRLGGTEQVRVTAVGAKLLASVGIEVDVPPTAEYFLDALIARFGDDGFPTAVEFSRFAKESLGDEIDLSADPDDGLLAYYDREEMLFRIFERHLLEERFSKIVLDGFDVDVVLQLSMSTFQRRKSRAGLAFETQLAAVFDAQHISYSAQGYTEGKSKPDFVFPSIADYKDPAYPAERLTMLGAKTTIKERWRQVLDEADRIQEKHLVTLEPAVSESYTNAMQKDHLRLVVPRRLFETFTAGQREWLMGVGEFCDLVRGRQSSRG